jgi:hypothetical protein
MVATCLSEDLLACNKGASSWTLSMLLKLLLQKTPVPLQ